LKEVEILGLSFNLQWVLMKQKRATLSVSPLAGANINFSLKHHKQIL